MDKGKMENERRARNDYVPPKIEAYAAEPSRPLASSPFSGDHIQGLDDTDGLADHIRGSDDTDRGIADHLRGNDDTDGFAVHLRGNAEYW